MDPLVALYMCARHAAGSAEVSQVRARLRDHQRLLVAVLRGLGAVLARSRCPRARCPAVRAQCCEMQLTAQHQRVMRVRAQHRRSVVALFDSALTPPVVFLIGCASSLVLTLSGVLKDVLLVLFSVLFFGSPVSFLQIVGYAIALLGLVAFKTPKDVWEGYVARARGLAR